MTSEVTGRPGPQAPAAHQAGSDGDGDGPIIIANEFADVTVRRVRTRNGARLEIFSPRRGTRVLLDAVELDCLSYQQPEAFTAMLERTPGG
ncbi:MAG: hypothetical protein ACRDQ1_17580 [Sciscionella sp.]